MERRAAHSAGIAITRAYMIPIAMSIPITDTVLRAGDALDLTLGERALLLALAFRADDSGAVTLPRAALARQIGQPKSNAHRLFASLTKKDLIVTRGKATFINTPALEVAAQKVITMITLGYHHDNPAENKGYHHDNPEVITTITKSHHHDNPEVITTITKSYHHDNPINKHKDNSALIARARAEGLEDFLALYPAEKRDANTLEELAPIYLDCLKETTKLGLLRALEEQKRDRQWTEAKGRYISKPLNWLARKAFRKFLPDLEAEARAAHRQSEERMVEEISRAADDGTGEDAKKIESLNAENCVGAFQARHRLAAVKIAASDKTIPARVLHQIAQQAAIGLKILDTQSAKLPDTITVSGTPTTISEIRAIVSSILQPRKAAQ